MWFEEVDEVLKGYFPYYVLVFLPIFIIVSPGSPAMASHEFPVYRMQHLDLYSVSYGCRGSNINMEARSLTGWSTSRHCIIAHLQDLTIENFRNIKAKAGGLLILLPDNIALLSTEDREHLIALETSMLSQEVSIPVYYTHSSQELLNIHREISTDLSGNEKSKSAAEAMLGSVAGNLYQVVINTKTPSVKADIKLATIQGNLIGKSSEGKLPTIAIVAHYDAYGIAPELSFGADSNGSGVAMLLELLRLLSMLYSDPKTIGKYNIVFLLTGGGKVNYQGSKKWLEEQLDSLDGSIIQDASYVLCVDTMSASNNIYMHVSKPPREGSAAAQFHAALKTAADRYPHVSIEGVHKKINLADDMLAWEHERFSIRRLPAFTLSSLKTHKSLERGTILDVYDHVDMDTLELNTKIIAEALASQIYNVSIGQIFGNTLNVERSALSGWLSYLSSQSRSSQALSNKDNPVVNILRDTFTRYLRDVKISYASPDKRDPEFQFYDITKGTMNIYNVKPAIFDLVLTLVITLYLVGVYFAIHKFPFVYSAACSLISNKKVK